MIFNTLLKAFTSILLGCALILALPSLFILSALKAIEACDFHIAIIEHGTDED